MRIKATEAQLEKAFKKIAQYGQVSYDPQTDRGEFRAKGVEGNFFYDEKMQVLHIDITDKPFLASVSMIEEKIREFFN